MQSYLTLWLESLDYLDQIKAKYQRHKRLVALHAESQKRNGVIWHELSGEDFSEKDFDELYNHVCEAEKLIKRFLISILKRETVRVVKLEEED